MNEQEILCFADIQAEEVKWLWYPYIPYGKITILQGDPGCGKTMAVLSLAALLSKGESLPFEEAAREPINILYQTSEDGIADTIKPRLESAGANCTRIKIINEEKRALTFDDPRLEQSILRENARLLILDPLSAYIGPTVSMNQANEVRGAFRSLYAMAQRTKCAVLIVAHMNKMSGISALYRTSGSIDIAGAVRSILTVTRYQRSPTQRVLVPVKSNLAAAGPALLFELSDHVEWLRQLDEDAESLLNGYDSLPEAPTKQQQVEEELPRLLEKGPVIGVFVFLSVYADDFKCRSMQVAIGFGMPRSRIILAKLLESALLLLGAAVAVGVLVLCAPAVLGLAPDARQTLSLALTVAAEMLRALGYLALSAVPVFLSQDAAGGVIAYVLLASKSVYIILSLVLGQEVFTATFGDLTQYLYTAQLYMAKADLIGGRAFALPFAAALLLYIILPAAVSVAGFRKQELEF